MITFRNGCQFDSRGDSHGVEVVEEYRMIVPWLDKASQDMPYMSLPQLNKYLA